MHLRHLFSSRLRGSLLLGSLLVASSFSTQAAEEMLRKAVGKGAYEMAYSQQENALWIATSQSRKLDKGGVVYRLDPVTLEVTQAIHNDLKPFGATINNTTQTLWFGNTVNSAVTAIDAKTGEVKGRLVLDDRKRTEEVRPLQPRELVADDTTNTVYISGIGKESVIWVVDGEIRRLEDIRASLRDPQCKGPEQVYSIAMDVGKEEHRVLLNKLHLLFGVVTYSAGKLGQEPVRSQGHIHKISPYSGWSTPEIYEIWSGEAIIYMQEYAEDQPGRCYAVHAFPGDVVIVPPYWVHATISANPRLPLTFGAWCDRDYGFVYEGVRKHGGIAWFPIFNGSDELEWIANPMYDSSHLICKSPSDYISLDIRKGVSIYRQFEENPEIFLYVPNPALKAEVWRDFEP